MDIEDGWRLGAGVDVIGQICREAPEPADWQRKSDKGKIGHLSVFFNETRDQLKVHAHDSLCIHTLFEITVDARLFEAALAEAKIKPIQKEYRAKIWAEGES